MDYYGMRRIDPESIKPEGEMPPLVNCLPMREALKQRKKVRPLTHVLLFLFFFPVWVAVSFVSSQSLVSFNQIGELQAVGQAVFAALGMPMFILAFFACAAIASVLRSSAPQISWFVGFVVGMLLFGTQQPSSTKVSLIQKYDIFVYVMVLACVFLVFLCSIYRTHWLRRRRCTEPITAKCSCISVEQCYLAKGGYALRRILYYKYQYAGLDHYCDCKIAPYRTYDLPFSWLKKPSLNDTKEIRVNPESPEEYWEVRKDTQEMWLGIGLLVAFAAISCAFCFMSTLA